jgi:imidazolonepropionase-like amidohydrolase
MTRAQERVTYMKAGRLFDGTSNVLRENVVIVIRGKTIAEVGSDITIPANAAVIDLSSMTVMPGLIDAHTHIAVHPGNYEQQTFKETPEFRAICATVSAKTTLDAGITTIRDVGNEGPGFPDVALRDAINRGIVPGPTILTAIQPVTATGAYDLVGYSPYLRTPSIAFEADGTAEVRKQVRQLVKLGADLIKIYMESYEKKQLPADSLTGAMGYSAEELYALVDEAHRSGMPVAAHTYSDAAARIAIEAGVNSIEHGLYINEETFRMMAAKGIFYVPTLLVYELWRDGKIFGPVSPENRVKLANTVTRHTDTFKRALKTPVKIVLGTDTFELPGTNAQELELMVRYGMKPIDALVSATSSAAALLGISKGVGTIERGKSADIIAFRGNPLIDISTLQHVEFVMKKGALIRSTH